MVHHQVVQRDPARGNNMGSRHVVQRSRHVVFVTIFFCVEKIVTTTACDVVSHDQSFSSAAC